MYAVRERESVVNYPLIGKMFQITSKKVHDYFVSFNVYHFVANIKTALNLDAKH